MQVTLSDIVHKLFIDVFLWLLIETFSTHKLHVYMLSYPF